MIYALGIDPGTPSAYALVELPDRGRARVLQHGEVRHLPYRAALLEAWERAGIGIMEPVQCAVEGQWLPSDAGKGDAHRAHAVSVIPLAQSAGGWVEACSSLGWGVTQVLPQVWRAGVYGDGVRWRGQSSAQLKALAVQVCAGLYGIRVMPSHHHVAEAILIAGWMAETVRHAQATAQPVARRRGT